MATEAKVTAIIEAKDSTGGALNSAGTNFASFAGKLAAVTAVAYEVYDGFKAVVEASADAQVKIASMDATLAAVGDTTAKTRNSILTASQAFVKLGFDDEEAAKSMATLYQRTKNVAEAQKLTALAADLARAKHLDLESATKLVSLALSGQGRALLQYGIKIKDAATPLEALGELQKVVGGQAQKFSQTFTGQGEVLTQTWENFKQALGDQILPTLVDGMTKLVYVVENLVDWAKQAWKAIVDFATSTGLVALWKMQWDSIVTTFKTNLLPALAKLWEAIQPMMPFLKALAIVIGVALFGAIVILSDAITILINIWTTLFTIMVDIDTFLYSNLAKSIQFVIDKISDLVLWVQKAIDAISRLNLSKVSSSIGNAVSGAAKSVGNALSSVVPHFDQGGIVPGPVGSAMFAVVHGGERVIPNGVGYGGGGINITITGNNISSGLDIRNLADAVGREVMRNLRMAQQV